MENLLNEIDNNSIVISSPDVKKYILKNIKKLLNVKYMTFKNFLKKYYFDYDENTILYLIKKYKIKYEVAVEYLNNLYYIEDKKYNIDKLDFLVKIKKDLISKNLLIYDDEFKKSLKNKKIIVYLNHLSKFENYILKGLNVKIIDIKKSEFIPKIYEFATIEDEVNYVAFKISELIRDGISINKIKLVNVSDEYINYLNRIFSFYNLKTNINHRISILSTEIAKIFYDNLDLGISRAIEKINDYNKTDIYNKIVSICNKYIWCNDINDLKLLIYEDLKSTYIEYTNYTNEIECVDYKTYYFSDEYVFLLGFNQGIIPRLSKDEDYISDSIKPSYLDDTTSKNNLEKKNTIDILSSIENLIITYKKKTPFSIYYPSTLIDDLNVKVEHVDRDYINSYSALNDKLKLAKSLDDLIKFGTHFDNLDILNSNYDIPYNTYSHEFTKVNKNKIDKYISSLPSFNLSYTSMDNYNRCAFRFYIEKILNLKNYKEEFSVTLGNIYHYVLSFMYLSNISVSDIVYNYIKENNIELNNSNKFFIEKTIKNLEYLIEIIKKQAKYSNLNNVELEKYISVPIKDNIKLVGFIDKIIYNSINDLVTLAIIDYKTYVKAPTLKYIDSGINIQLPTYMFLAKSNYKNVRFSGFYLQNITLDNKSNEEKEKSLRLIGYSNKDKEILKELDNNYFDSKVLDGIKVKIDGEFSKSSQKNLLSNEDIEYIIDLTRKKIDEVICNILDAKFDINPKYDNGPIGCEFCKFNDICYKREYDYVNIKPNDKFDREDRL